MIETYEIYDGEEHIGVLQVNGNRQKVEFDCPSKNSPYSFEMINTEWVRPIPYFERVLSEYYDDPYAVVLEDKDSSIVLYRVD